MKFNVKFYIHEVCFCASQERNSSCPHSSVLQSTSGLQEAVGLVQHLQTDKIILILFPVAPKVRLPFMFNVVCQCYMKSKSSQIPGEDFTDLTNDPHQAHILVKTCDIDVSHLRARCRSGDRRRRSGKNTGGKKTPQNAASNMASFQRVKLCCQSTFSKAFLIDWLVVCGPLRTLFSLFFPLCFILLFGCFTAYDLEGLRRRSQFQQLNIVHWEVGKKRMRLRNYL